MGGLLRLAGQVILAVILIGGSAAVFSAIAGVAFRPLSRAGRSGGGSRTPRSPSPRAAVAHPRNSTIRTQARANIRRMREETRLTDWIEQQRHARQNGTGGTATVTRPTLAQRLMLAPFVAQPPDPGNGGSTGTAAGADGTSVPVTPGMDPEPPAPDGEGGWANAGQDELDQRRRRNGDQQPDPAPEPAASSTDGGTPVAAGTSTASAEKLIEGINEIHAHAAAGGIHAKREALAAMHEAAVRFAAMAQMVARTMSEPGSNYGNEITEPIAKGGQQFQAGAITIGEAEASLATLINMSVGDLATSARQAPHHRELSENGSR